MKSPLLRSLLLLLVLFLLASCRTIRPAGTLVMAWESFPLSLDPRYGSDQASQRLLALTHQGLLKRNQRLELVADGCLSWRWDEPYRVLSFEFPSPEGLSQLTQTWFSFDVGRPLWAEDAQDSLESLCDSHLKSPKAGPFKEEMESMEIQKDGPTRKRLILRLKRSNPGFPANLVRGALALIPAGFRGDRPPGTGLYRLVQFEAERSLRLQAKTDHPGARSLPGRLLHLEARLIPDATTRTLALRHGTVGAALNNLPPDLLNTLQNLHIQRVPGINLEYIAFRCEHPILGDPRVRQALSLALDRTLLTRGIMGGLARPATAFYPPELPWGTQNKEAVLSERLAQASQLLNASGHSLQRDGTRFQLRLSATPETHSRTKALALQSQWRRIGVELRIESKEFGSLLSEIVSGKFEVASLRWVGASEPDMLFNTFHSSRTPPRGFNRGRFHDAETDRLLEASRQAPDAKARYQDCIQVQRRLWDLAPYAYLWWTDQVAVLPRGVRLDLNGVGDFSGAWEEE